MRVHFGLGLEEITVEVRSVTLVTLPQVPLPVACTGWALALGLASESLGVCGGEPGTSRPGASPRASLAALGQPGRSRVFLTPFGVTFARHLTCRSQRAHLQEGRVVSFSAGLEA